MADFVDLQKAVDEHEHFYANRHEFDTSLMPGSFDHGEQMDGIEPENTYPDHPLPPLPPRMVLLPVNTTSGLTVPALDTDGATHSRLQPPLDSETSRPSTQHVHKPNRKTDRAAVEEELRQGLAASKTESDILRAEVFELKSNLKKTQESLTEAGDFIFSQVPKQQAITETDAAAEYKSLCDAVDEWVETNLGDHLEDRCLVKDKKYLPTPTRDFLNLMSGSGKESIKCPGTDTYNIMAAIMFFIHEEIFKRDLCGVVSREAAGFLSDIEKYMRNLVPQRDVVTLRQWHSETYTALASSPDLLTRRRDRTAELAFRLGGMLSMFKPLADRGTAMTGIESSIIAPAVSLAYRMYLSIDVYCLEWTHLNRPAGPSLGERQLSSEDLFNLEVINVFAAGKLVRSIPAGLKIEYLLDIMPQLVIRRVKGDTFADRKILKRSKVLVKVETEKRGKHEATVPKSGEDATVLQWLDRTVHSRSFYSR